MRVIVELYDDDMLNNLLAAMTFRPQVLLMVCEHRVAYDEALKARFMTLLRGAGVSSEVRFISAGSNAPGTLEEVFSDILREWPDARFDITGGRDIPLFTAGRFCQKENVPAFFYSRMLGKYRNAYHCPEAAGVEGASLTVGQLLDLAGGKYMGHGRFEQLFDLDALTEEDFDDAATLWDIYRAFRGVWSSQILYMQQLVKRVYMRYPLRVGNVPVNLYGSHLNLDFLKALEQAGLVHSVKLTNKTVDLQFKSMAVRCMLADAGLVLELYAYGLLCRQERFSDVSTSVMIDWNGQVYETANLVNEVDIVATRGTSSLFVSCKIGQLARSDVDELYTLAARFGGIGTHACLLSVVSLAETQPTVYKRACDLGICIIEGDDLLGDDFPRLLADTVEQWL